MIQLTLDETLAQVSAKIEDGATLAAHLYTVAAWQTRHQLATALGWEERRIRAAGEYSRGKVIFGQNGMRHIATATLEEIMACENTLFSQARRNSERACEIMRARHHKTKHPI